MLKKRPQKKGKAVDFSMFNGNIFLLLNSALSLVLEPLSSQPMWG